ncbi:hypothetical protein JXC34_04325 [Candidatus Woesearchaeota archaeon]|nr:hypothetical protein [Candidatus Woesearchaeota archaeon]
MPKTLIDLIKYNNLGIPVSVRLDDTSIDNFAVDLDVNGFSHSVLLNGHYSVEGVRENSEIHLTICNRDIRHWSEISFEQFAELARVYSEEMSRIGSRLVLKSEIQSAANYFVGQGLTQELADYVVQGLDGKIIEIRPKSIPYLGDFGAALSTMDKIGPNYTGFITSRLAFFRRIFNGINGVRYDSIVKIKSMSMLESGVKRCVILPIFFGWARQHELRHTVQQYLISQFLNPDSLIYSQSDIQAEEIIDRTLESILSSKRGKKLKEPIEDYKEDREENTGDAANYLANVFLPFNYLRMESTAYLSKEIFIALLPLAATSILGDCLTRNPASESLLTGVSYTALMSFITIGLLYNPIARKRFQKCLSETREPIQQLANLTCYYCGM